MNDRQKSAQWAIDLLNRGNFAILDTETTGLEGHSEICSISIIGAEGSTLLDTLVKPTIRIEPGAIAVHSITNDDVKSAPPFDQVLLSILKVIGNRDLVIYNAEFDLRLIRQSLRPHNIHLAFPTSDRRGCRIFLNGGSINCAMLHYSQWIGDWSEYHGNYRWQRLPGGDHSSLGDCRATLEVIRKMAETPDMQGL